MSKVRIEAGRGAVKVEEKPFEDCIAVGSSEKEPRRLSHYERTKAQVYATGNRWAIENFHATHD